MRPLWTTVRPGERLVTALAFSTLMLVMAAHAVMETARDTLFLTSIPATQLPWVYLGIAFIALVIQRLESRMPTRRLHVVLVGWLSGSTGVTVAFWHFLDRMGDVGLYALYMWSGTMASLILVHFWSLLGSHLTVIDAKRLYAVIGVGGSVGAILGSALAAIGTVLVGPKNLLLVSSGILGLSVAGAFAIGKWGGEPVEKREDEREPSGLFSNLHDFVQSGYLRRIALLVIIGAVTVTFVDIVFKAVAAERVPDGELGEFFALTYFTLNFLSLGVQVLLVRPTIRRLSVTGALAILPSLLLAGGVGALAGGRLLGVLAMKGADGAIRHSLNRTAVELLYVPLSNKVRARVKSTIDVVGQRFGQALASLLILGGVWVGVSEADFLWVGALLAGAWIAAARAVKGPYLEVFRNVLRDEHVAISLEYPDLDLAGLETLVEALNSPDDARVIAALNILAEEGKTSVIPALILYHPSQDVVMRALELFMEAERTDYFSVARRIEANAPTGIQAAVLAALASEEGASELLRERAKSDNDVVRTTACFLLSVLGEEERGEDFHDAFRHVLATGSVEARVALADAIGLMRAQRCRAELTQLLEADEAPVRAAALRAMSKIGDIAFVEPIRDSLADRRLRRNAMNALVALGEPAMYRLAEALRDETIAPQLRWQLPRAIASFETREAADILVRALPDERDGMVRYRLVRELERLRRRVPRMKFATTVLRRSAEATIRNAYELMDWRITLTRELEEHPEFRTETAELMGKMLADKLEHAVDLLIRELGLLHPREDFAAILRGLRAPDPQRQASSRELLEHAVPGDLKDAVLGLVDDAPDLERVYAGASHYTPKMLDFHTLLALMIDGESDTLRLFAIEHIGELGLVELKPKLEALGTRGDEPTDSVVERALRCVSEAGQQPTEPGHAR